MKKLLITAVAALFIGGISTTDAKSLNHRASKKSKKNGGDWIAECTSVLSDKKDSLLSLSVYRDFTIHPATCSVIRTSGGNAAPDSTETSEFESEIILKDVDCDVTPPTFQSQKVIIKSTEKKTLSLTVNIPRGVIIPTSLEVPVMGESRDRTDTEYNGSLVLNTEGKEIPKDALTVKCKFFESLSK